ncbi:MAG: CBS and ACT domain-containing protein [Eubacteriaceae bacterium]
MIVEEIMKKKLITLLPDSTISEAINIMRNNKIRHLPVIDKNNKLLGIVSDRDLRDASPSILNTHNEIEYQTKIESIMTTNLITGSPLDFVEDVAAILYEFKIGCIPILSMEKLVGIVTETDLLHTFVKITGAHEPSSHIELKIIDKPGILSQITSVFQERNLNIISVLLYPDKDIKYKILVIRAQIMNPNQIVSDLITKGYEVVWPKKI